MKYDFTTILDRKGQDAMALDALGEAKGFAPDAPDEGFSPIPMWVADMNFATLPAIPEAIIKRASHPAYGYFFTRQEYYDSIIWWQKERNGIDDIKKEYIGHVNGVLGGVVSTMNAICERGGSVLLHSPTYIGFTHCLKDNGYNIVDSPLVRDESGTWRMDISDMEKKLVENRIHAAILCSPHNPCGRVWEKWELEEAMELFRKHDVYVISDEIWSDIIMPGYKHIPTQSISEDAAMRTASFYAPTKTFNLAGLAGSYHLIRNGRLRDRVTAENDICHKNALNVLSMHALMAAYSPDGAEWVDELNTVLDKNITLVCDHINSKWKGLSVERPQGTYMLFVDCKDWIKETGRSLEDLEKAFWKIGVAIQDGKMFKGKSHIRMNLALPESLVREALERADRHIFGGV